MPPHRLTSRGHWIIQPRPEGLVYNASLSTSASQGAMGILNLRTAGWRLTHHQGAASVPTTESSVGSAVRLPHSLEGQRSWVYRAWAVKAGLALPTPHFPVPVNLRSGSQEYTLMKGQGGRSSPPGSHWESHRCSWVLCSPPPQQPGVRTHLLP